MLTPTLILAPTEIIHGQQFAVRHNGDVEVPTNLSDRLPIRRRRIALHLGSPVDRYPRGSSAGGTLGVTMNGSRIIPPEPQLGGYRNIQRYRRPNRRDDQLKAIRKLKKGCAPIVLSNRRSGTPEI
jgi:hypothetical protein